MFEAQADPGGHALPDRPHDRSGQTLGELCAGPDTARQSVSGHLAVPAAVGVVTGRRSGREKPHFPDAATIDDIADRWIRRHARAQALTDRKRAPEAPADTGSRRTTSVDATPRSSDGPSPNRESTRRRWKTGLVSSWAQGGPVTWDGEDDPGQVVLESGPPRRLSHA